MHVGRYFADFSYVRTSSKMAFTTFVTGMYSCQIAGWRTMVPITDLPRDDLELALRVRGCPVENVAGVIRRSDAVSRYTAFRYTEPSAQIVAVATIGTIGDSYRSINALEDATAEYIERFYHRRLHGEVGMIPPFEFEDDYHHHQTASATAGAALASL